MQTPDYFWNYLPLLMQILVAVGFGAGIVTASWFIGRHRYSAAKLASYECGIVGGGRPPRALFRSLLHGRHALHPLRRGSRVHASLGRGLPRSAKTGRFAHVW